MKQRYFPIKTATACQLKWNWSTLYLHEGTTASCHRTGWGKITPDNFNEFHNTEKKQHERNLMLQGQWPIDSCQYCREIEESGGFSDRLLHLQIPGMSPPELDQDPKSVVVSPTILEVFFNNTCNLSCLYCIPNLSSKIHQENLKFGDFQSQGVSLLSAVKDDNYTVLIDKFWQWMHNHSHNLKRFNVLGGEPFYQEEFYLLIEYFEKHPHPELELGIVTNLMISEDKLKSLISKFKSLLSSRCIKRIDITCSIDCWGVEQEYVRFGLDLESWEKNFNLLLENTWLKLNINQTISVLTIKTMSVLLQKLNSWKHARPVGHFFSAVSPQPSYLMPQILGPDIFDQDFKNILKEMPTETDQDQTAIKYMRGIRDRTLSATPDENEKQNLKIFLDEKDRRRKTSWREIFPWLIKELDHVV